MTKYVNYDFYFNILKGQIIPDEDSFNSVIYKASSKVKYYTKGRINEKNIPEEVKNTTCLISELIYENDRLKGQISNQDLKEKASETVGPHTISFVNKTQQISNQIKSEMELEKDIYKICLQQLAYTGLMYAGGVICFHIQ